VSFFFFFFFLSPNGHGKREVRVAYLSIYLHRYVSTIDFLSGALPIDRQKPRCFFLFFLGGRCLDNAVLFGAPTSQQAATPFRTLSSPLQTTVASHRKAQACALTITPTTTIIITAPGVAPCHPTTATHHSSNRLCCRAFDRLFSVSEYNVRSTIGSPSGGHAPERGECSRRFPQVHEGAISPKTKQVVGGRLCISTDGGGGGLGGGGADMYPL